jgi:hypothetical protein
MTQITLGKYCKKVEFYGRGCIYIYLTTSMLQANRTAAYTVS